MSTAVALVGCGRWGENILRDLVAMGLVVPVADPDPTRRQWALSHGASVAVPEVGALPQCDGYVAATPAVTQRAVVEALLARAGPVFVEKPPCNDITDVRELVAQAGDRLYVMHKWRYHPGVCAARDLLNSGSLGVPISIETIRTGPDMLPVGVDVTWHLATHDLSIALELLGSVPEVLTASGDIGTDSRIRACKVTLEGPQGAIHRMTVAAENAQKVRSLRLVGSDRSLFLADAYDQHVVIVDGSGRESTHTVGNEMPLERELRAFVQHVNGGPPPRSSGVDALAVCEQIARIDVLVRGSL